MPAKTIFTKVIREEHALTVILLKILYQVLFPFNPASPVLGDAKHVTIKPPV